jgi:geranylgeranyl reductase family protein
MKNYHSVIIVGAGPAGATLAYELAKRGIDVLILEKEKLPRYKACAGGVTLRAANLLGFDISPVIQHIVYGGRITYKLNKGFIRRYDKPLVYMVMRDEFDHFLTSISQEAGAIVAEGQKVCSMQITDEKVKISTTNDTFIGEILVGADGANSFVAKTLGLVDKIELSMTVEAEVKVSGETLSRWDGLVAANIGCTPGGYEWVFPKQDHLSIGAAASFQEARNLKTCYQRLLESLKLGNYEVMSFKGHPLPVRRKGTAIYQGKCLLIGDAAGLTNPLTGEGIYHAIKSAQLAAPVIAKCLESHVIDLCDYQQAVEDEIAPEMRLSWKERRFFTWFPRLSFISAWAISRNKHLWQVACQGIRGEGMSAHIRKRLRIFRGLLDLLGI